ncbi:hypothetical protein E3P77_00885 [Wallemia ichthyophaga]|uniref:Glycylpeptide N-tetradecanoyltransferase n=1 Tax=Wallemia ichthyophaga TaxID=245174 RepID=A0A4T0GCA6_WALIC|nr:hypothetical protein E3P91_00932 [Wallemia ichthyophaga]TIA82894.1 hypothetical protein E3P98_01109 [Wallemia ichthyophaga]TIA98150.1 hypothetical protein E3P95_02545 [Wallemia ichthyophaga]TIA99338.1 hypothetical protein E3P94_02592 [Wallemia ichthyophaga]TIB06246.1 hypothetical protein E3P96_00596 [Wallemia ichthyophaga]
MSDNNRKDDKKSDKVPINPLKAIQQQLSNNEDTNGLDKDSVRQLLTQMNISEVLAGSSGVGQGNKKDMGQHKFWSTQPVALPQEGSQDGPIDPTVDVEKFSKVPLPLPKEYEWVDVDLDNAQEVSELEDVRELLCLNYVEDDDATLRFNYSAEFIAWALKPPGYQKSWHVGVRVASGKRKLVAFIGAVPMTIDVNKRTLNTSEVNFLCVHKKLRSKRLAPVLIKEVTRRCNLKGVYQATYTGGNVLPGIISTCQYFHRPINVPKLVDTGFSQPQPGMSIEKMAKASDIPANSPTRPQPEGFREMEEKDVAGVTALLKAYLSRFELAPIFSQEEVRHTFLSGRGEGEYIDGKPMREKQVVWAYVVEDPQTKLITDFISFYSLPSTVVGNDKHPILDAAYMFYYATEKALPDDWRSSSTTVFPRKLEVAKRSRVGERLNRLVEAILRVSKSTGFDVFNTLTLMESNHFISDQKFKPGSGLLNYYIFNWKLSKQINGGIGSGRDCSGIALVML